VNWHKTIPLYVMKLNDKKHTFEKFDKERNFYVRHYWITPFFKSTKKKLFRPIAEAMTALKTIELNYQLFFGVDIWVVRAQRAVLDNFWGFIFSGFLNFWCFFRVFFKFFDGIIFHPSDIDGSVSRTNLVEKFCDEEETVGNCNYI
jgi:hypothetical protein